MAVTHPTHPMASSGGSVRNDTLNDKIMTAYEFSGESTDCSKKDSMVEDPLAAGYVKHPCARSSEVVMKKDFRGFNVTSPAAKGEPAEPLITVHIPPALKQAAKNTSKVAFSFFKNNSLFQDGLEKVKILNDVVEINVENEIITDLPEPIRIGFHHDVVPQLEPRPVCHLLVLTSITSLGCAVSVISCIALIIFLCKKSRRSKEQSTPIHLGLAISLALLNLLFFFTGVLANVEESVCTWVGAALHYTLLSSFAWMGIEVFHTFWLVYMVFSPFPKALCVEPAGFWCGMTTNHKALLAHYFINMTSPGHPGVLGPCDALLGLQGETDQGMFGSRTEWRFSAPGASAASLG
ncbi:Adhesion G-protein coupled receptor G6 [Larimichthys crocea]|uniref:Uncharacterized protein n=1 Tax=Larimichthys crocea TaxID=215358 RepID=A0ACD3R1K3_LARCR|nr:Adhesion G-protein coupled receptor G6 [Larimichthys crocea]